MSVDRSVNRAPLNDVHHVAEHVIGPERTGRQAEASSPEPDWTEQRKALPPEVLLPATVHWMSTLPADFQPVAIAAAFPRIANQLAALWPRPDALTRQLHDLLVDTHGGRRGFPVRILRELHALRAYYAGLHPDRRDLWNRRKPVR
jgi:hypothetical protein